MADAPLPLILNLASGLRGRAASSEDVRAAFDEQHVPIDMRESPPHGVGATMRSALARRPRMLAVAGGDGTIRSAASLLAGSGTALAPVPRGTLNYFTRRVGIESVQDTARAVAGGEIETVPFGVVDDEVFLNTATFGVYAHLVRRRERFRPFLTKWPAAAVALALSLRRIQPMHVVLDVEGERLVRRTPLVWVGLGWGSFPRAYEAAERRAEPDLEVAVLRTPNARSFVAFSARVGWRALRGEQPIRDSALEIHHTRSFVLQAPRRIDATLDGEPMRFRGPVFVGVQDDGLRVCVLPER